MLEGKCISPSQSNQFNHTSTYLHYRHSDLLGMEHVSNFKPHCDPIDTNWHQCEVWTIFFFVVPYIIHSGFDHSKNSSSVRHLSWQAYHGLHGLLRSKSQKTSVFLPKVCLWLAATTEVNIGSLRLCHCVGLRALDQSGSIKCPSGCPSSTPLKAPQANAESKWKSLSHLCRSVSVCFHQGTKPTSESLNG